ncbi:hypothetical protein NCAS_0F03400 [Naumovozyma castellii]|uniref:Decapping nuclease n=1 Tax=Naumovozyma castellii TaxID=27288 RepID=G0VH52_NAUCA|nr:hypothetical protein NCAS_0F03400 [Naumovozyma castellii CBS 4309]CCC70824.1 hypothetical protein NCAS_0F03400 [Naumovozyma castellii CBS 4309]
MKKTGQELMPLHTTVQSQKQAPITRVPFGEFSHSSISLFPTCTQPFYESSNQVALYHNHKLYPASQYDIIPHLKNDIAQLPKKSASEARTLKRSYLGSDLYDGFETFVPMSAKDLDSLEPCMSFIKDWERKASTKYKPGRKFNIVSTRHHIVEMTMKLFTGKTNNYNNTKKVQDYVLNVVYTGDETGRLLFTKDWSNTGNSMNEGIYSKNIILKRICYSGFALEDLMTETTSELEKEGEKLTGGEKAVFAVVENKLDDDICILLRCELDAFNGAEKKFTELKCFSPLKMSNFSHRRKLLKAWVQTGVLPDSDILIGIRDSSFGELEDVEWYSRDRLRSKINNRNLPESKIDWNFNAQVATQWSQHCIRSICKLVDENLDQKAISNPQGFQIRIDSRRNIRIKCLSKVPKDILEYL